MREFLHASGDDFVLDRSHSRQMKSFRTDWFAGRQPESVLGLFDRKAVPQPGRISSTPTDRFDARAVGVEAGAL
jgi:hypothetical protein